MYTGPVKIENSITYPDTFVKIGKTQSKLRIRHSTNDTVRIKKKYIPKL